MQRAIIDSGRLAEITDSDLLALKASLETGGFTSDFLLSKFGKKVLRYINISDREETLLRRQILHNDARLLGLVDLFLLGRAVSSVPLPDHVTAALMGAGILVEGPEGIFANACLTPLAGRYFLNDGDYYLDHPDHVLKLVLEQPYLIEVCRAISPNPSRTLDICSGSGVIGQGSANAAISGYDINPRAIDYATFNARFNGLHAHYEIQDACGLTPKRRYDLVVANPPYSAYVPTDITRVNKTLHSGQFGDTVPRAIVSAVPELLNEGGLFAMVSTLLIKDGKLWHPMAAQLESEGTLVLLHHPIASISTWEGMRLLYAVTPDYDSMPPGSIIKATKEQFDSVTWGILLYRKSGRPGFHKVYNLSTDAVLINQECLAGVSNLLALHT